MNQEQKANAKAIPPEREELYEIMKNEGNNVCADCGSSDPVWVSLILGVFMCIECSGAHRNLGTLISKGTARCSMHLTLQCDRASTI